MNDVIVLGLGGMGSAAAYHLARRGRRVLGLEQFDPVHDRGSSHGETRMIRECYSEHPSYVPLVQRAYENWRQLERDSGLEGILTITGGLYVGAPDSEIIAGARRSATEHGLRHEILDADEIRRRYPELRPDAADVGFFDFNTGFLRCETAVKAHLDGAARHGAELRFRERIVEWSADERSVRVRTERGRYEAGHLIVAAGAWGPATARLPTVSLRPERRVLYWVQPGGGVDPFRLGRFPCFTWDLEGNDFLYGFPSVDGTTVKVAFMHAGGPCDPDTVDRTVSPEEMERIRAALRRHMPAMDGPVATAKTCMYTLTPDQHFVIGLHPEYSRVTLTLGFSGHGFKFASVVGEIAADLAEHGATRHPIALFDPRRPELLNDSAGSPETT